MLVVHDKGRYQALTALADKSRSARFLICRVRETIAW